MKKILIANRGEIALRIMRTCREMNIKSVAVFSEADRNAPFVQYADEAYCIGPAASSSSYLVIDKIVEVAKASGAEGIHPGYGFLSENPVFARRLEKEGITLIGPPAAAMEVMGNKLAAKETAKAYNIPLVPGTEGAIDDLSEAKKVAVEIGFPVLIKASAGGGGKGMRTVENEAELEEQVKMAMSEAKSAFGDSSVFIERYVKSPRHIEIQVLADKHGNAVHLFERECSIQRRHQKVIEEAPSAVLTPALREAMGKCAVDLTKACNYEGAGTVEFLLDDKLNFFFLEMNTRLQVEHPVSEMITGIDLVRQQILVARGEKLAFTQEDITMKGHALEVRVYAEDPQNNFLPDIGKLVTYKRPQGPGVRVDDGFEEGMNIPIYYDPMISKLITYADTREQAIERMTRAIREYEITGVKTTLSFCDFAINHDAFKSGNFDTHFVNQYFKPEVLDNSNPEHELAIAAFMGAIGIQGNVSEAVEVTSNVKNSAWKTNRKLKA
ncbi:MAG: acetyl-CoA carboxylase biotin carboxylase subunit [Salibacteraceae bacterium]|nr:acetyl-CoA carboxylase biotin carboxylase subunit [Salibacteraceae bacterium]MDP4685679.1 acetyl-CoA carboxylase biotin carboxylase subunit [Salibacteraceae bacterium]MDP4762453.1 acetyl-CoA carboxylase biotin carboxylase subunit [Salibacteraceae bacterium]